MFLMNISSSAPNDNNISNVDMLSNIGWRSCLDLQWINDIHLVVLQV